MDGNLKSQLQKEQVGTEMVQSQVFLFRHGLDQRLKETSKIVHIVKPNLKEDYEGLRKTDAPWDWEEDHQAVLGHQKKHQSTRFLTTLPKTVNKRLSHPQQQFES